MATVILIVFLAVAVILGGWWMKTERERQKKDLVKQGKIASGKLDDSLLPKQKPAKRKRKKREGNWLDPKYVPPEIPDKQMLADWLDRAVKLIDELMPLVHAYRKSISDATPLQTAQRTAEAKATLPYPSDAVSGEEALDWYTTLEERVSALLDARATLQQTNKALRKQHKPMADKMVALRSLLAQAQSWELYKAPEAFHEKLELVECLQKELGSESILGSAPDVTESKDNSWRRRRNWSQIGEPESEPAKDTGIVDATRHMLMDMLPLMAALQAAVKAGQQAQSDWRDASKQISLARPARPTDEDVEAVLAEALAWAKSRDRALKQALPAAQILRQAHGAVRAPLSELQTALALLRDADIPEADKPVKEALERAVASIEAQYKESLNFLNEILTLDSPKTLSAEEQQTANANAVKLRTLIRKAGFSVAQYDAARRSVEAAKADKPQLGETAAPTLAQSSPAAFANVHARMTEITARNNQKQEAHATRVRQLEQQRSEREQQMKQALEALRTEVKSGSRNYAADMAIMQPAAEVFAASY